VSVVETCHSEALKVFWNFRVVLGMIEFNLGLIESHEQSVAEAMPELHPLPVRECGCWRRIGMRPVLGYNCTVCLVGRMVAHKHIAHGCLSQDCPHS
jgi:hypothetical protein